MDFDALINQNPDYDLLQELTLDESKSFVEVLILTVLVDGEITEDELEGLSAQWSQLPFASDPEQEEVVGQHGFEVRQFLETNFEDEGKISEFISEVASRFEREDLKAAALRMIAIVSGADGLEQAETDLAVRLGTEFGYDTDQIAEIVGSVAG